MKLTCTSIKKLVNGACHSREENGYTYFYHFSEKQLEHFEKRYQFWYERALLQTGIKIELITDSESLSLDYYSPSVYSGDNSIDVYVNDMAVYVHHIEKSGKGKLECVLPCGKKTVTVYLPIDVPVGIKSITVDGTYKSVRSRRAKLLAIGDSITQGYGAGIAGSTYINSLYRKTGYDILCQGIGGYRYEKGSVMPIDGYIPDKILVALGTNYYDDETYDYATNIEEFYETLHSVYGDTPVLTVTPVYRFDEAFKPERFQKVVEKIKSVCAKYPNIKVLCGWNLIYHISECYLDPVHPNAYGSELMAQGISDFMKKIRF